MGFGGVRTDMGEKRADGPWVYAGCQGDRCRGGIAEVVRSDTGAEVIGAELRDVPSDMLVRPRSPIPTEP